MNDINRVRAQRASKVIEAVVAAGAWRGVLYVDPKTVVRATRRCYRGRVTSPSKPFDMVVSFTRPNYREREFLARCKRAGEPFPVKKVQLQFKKAK